MRHARLLVRTFANCSNDAPYCLDDDDDDDEQRLEAEARAMMARMIGLLEPSAEGATPVGGIDPRRLPRAVELNRLAGRSIPGKHFEACAFDNDPVDHAGTGTATIGLRCGSPATGIVAIGDADVEAIPNRPPYVVDNVVVCSRGARQSDCYLRHRMVQLSTTVDCPGGCRDGTTPSALMALVAQLLATLP